MQPATIAQVDVDTTAALLAAGDLTMVVLDVREDEEWRFGHAPGAVHIPMSTLRPASPNLTARSASCACAGPGTVHHK